MWDCSRAWRDVSVHVRCAVLPMILHRIRIVSYTRKHLRVTSLSNGTFKSVTRDMYARYRVKRFGGQRVDRGSRYIEFLGRRGVVGKRCARVNSRCRLVVVVRGVQQDKRRGEGLDRVV